MQRIKIFSGAAYRDDLGQLERAIDEWIAGESRQVHFVAQSAVGAHLVVTIVYADADPETPRTAAGAVDVPAVFERTLEDTGLDPERPDDRPPPELELPY